jgi:hypothetical protein
LSREKKKSKRKEILAITGNKKFYWPFFLNEKAKMVISL